MARHDGHQLTMSTALRVLRDEGLLLEASYQRERRLAAERKAACCEPLQSGKGFRFVPRQPQHLADRERARGHTSGPPCPFRRSEAGNQLPSLRHRRRVVPQFRGPDHRTARVDRHQAVGLGVDGNRSYLRRFLPHLHSGHGLPHGDLERRPPVVRVLLTDRRRSGRMRTSPDPDRLPEAVRLTGPQELLQIAAVATQYYQEGRSKVDIAQDLGMSRFRLARLLTAARELGIVRIDITVPDAINADPFRRASNRLGPASGDRRGHSRRACVDLAGRPRPGRRKPARRTRAGRRCRRHRLGPYRQRNDRRSQRHQTLFHRAGDSTC
jgi:hypothetical protein